MTGHDRWFVATGLLGLSLFPFAVEGATLTVTTTADSGAGSLRQAIEASNASVGVLDTIAFAIGSGLQTISPLSPLPSVTDPVVIDGTTQPGFSGTPLVELDGATAGGTGLTITAGSSSVRGLVINRWATGISISGAGQNLVAGNFIGTDASGVLPPGNDSYGVTIDGSPDNLVGGPGVGEGNLIAFHSVRGVQVSGATGNTIRGNAIHSSPVGIDLVPDGVTANDPGDGDTGANDLQNWPVISSVEVLTVPQGTGTRIQGVLHSAASTLYDLDFYENPACSFFPGGYLGGMTYIGSGQVTTDGSGTGVFDLTLAAVVADGARITATATDPAGNTSEHSQRIVFSCLPIAGPSTGGTDVTLVGTDFAAGATVSIGGLPATNVNVVSFNRITATTPALPAGSANDVVATNTDGTSGTRTKGFIADFLDVPQNHQFWPFVTNLVSFGITAGVGGGLYGVTQPTLRQQMAAFLLKTKYGLCYTPPPCIVQVFDDVPCSSGFAPWINQLVAEGITGGCGDGTNYCPTNPVLRQQMAVLLLRAFEGTGYAPPACTVASFGDVPCSNPFSAWIYELVARSITAGCGGGNYCPTDSANRGQMATFVIRTFF
jgi:IPT/TIG domain/S-layer homology domain